jgi:hypothetical protein
MVWECSETKGNENSKIGMKMNKVKEKEEEENQKRDEYI